MKKPRLILLSATIFLCPLAQGQAVNARSAKLERLGKVSFPVSCSAGEQRAFNRAVALLHSFQYASAESAFGEIAQQDSRCAMAYWGEAMALYHELFDWPDNQTLKQGNRYVELAVKIGGERRIERAPMFKPLPLSFETTPNWTEIPA